MDGKLHLMISIDFTMWSECFAVADEVMLISILCLFVSAVCLVVCFL